ncbi:MAG: hypothetical protein WA803_16405 [Steroidobacteraceae bacterium]
MPAEIHSVAAVIDRFGDAAHLALGLDDEWRDIGSPQKLEGGGQAGRSCAGYYCNSPRIIAAWHGNWHLSGATSNEKKLTARREIPNEGKTGRSTLGNEVVRAQYFDAEGYDGGVDRNPNHSDAREACKLDARVFEPAILEYPGDRQQIGDE